MKLYKRFATVSAGMVLAISSILSVGFVPIASAASGSDTCTWTGAGDGVKFSDATNWSNCSGAAPVAGDKIEFTSPAAQDTDLTNDLGVALGGVITDWGDGTNYGGYTIDTIELADGAVLKQNTQTVCADNNAVRVSLDNVTSAGSVTDYIGAIGYNTTANITGGLTIDTGYLSLKSGSTIGSTLTLVPPVNYYMDGCKPQYGGGGGNPSGSNISGFTINSMAIQNGASTNLADIKFPLTLGGGSSSTAPKVSFYGATDTNGNYKATTYTISGKLTLLNNANFYVGDKTTVNITGAIDGKGFNISRTSDSNGTLNNQSKSDNSDTGSGEQKSKAKTTKLTDKKPTEDAEVLTLETTYLDGSRGYVTIDDGGVLKGIGTASWIYAKSGGIVAPGHSPGKLTVLNSLTLSQGSTYEAELKDAKAGDYDQIVVGDSKDKTGNDVYLNDSTLKVSLYKGYDIKAGDKFTIVDNKSQTKVDGTFKDLKEGATFAVGKEVFKISYKGGDGNDVVLTAQKTLSDPDTGFALLTTNPAVTAGITIILAGAVLVLAQRSRKLAGKR